MTAQELRIGNLFDFTADELGHLTIEEIRKDADGFNGYYAVFRNGSIKCLVDEDAMLPIPLTEEWLLKLGFEKVNGGLFKRHTDSETTLDWDCLTGLYLMGDDGKEIKEFDHIEYVHQLQNLYHALTSEELTIKEEGK